MKQQNNTVNSKEGALKQQKSTFQILNRIPVKAMAMVVLSTFLLTQLGFGQGDDSSAMSFGYNEPVNSAGVFGVCCVTDRPNPVKKTVKVDLPSASMIRKADHEATVNLIHSLHMNRVKEMGEMMQVGDQAINAIFVSETTMGRMDVETARNADDEVNLYFAAEHILPVNSMHVVNAEEELNDIFRAENGALSHQYGSVTDADALIDGQFTLENTHFRVSTAQTAKADEEINQNMQQGSHPKAAVTRLSLKK